jgi:hypothetical protein
VPSDPAAHARPVGRSAPRGVRAGLNVGGRSRVSRPGPSSA